MRYRVGIHAPVVNRCKDDFREFVDTLVVALWGMEQTENPLATIQPAILRESNLAAVKAEE